MISFFDRIFALVKVRRSPTLLSHSGLSHPGDFCLAVVCAGITCVGHLRFVTAAFFRLEHNLND